MLLNAFRIFSNNLTRKMSNGKVRPLLVGVEGNIGVGKTHALDCLAKIHPQAKIMREPVETWRHLLCAETGGEVNCLDLFYRDPIKYAFPFQVLVQSSYYRHFTRVYQEAIDDNSPMIITERTLATNFHVFARLLLEDGLLSLENFSILEYLFQTNLSPNPHLGSYDSVIYLKASPETCMQRSNHRKRPEEQNYLKLDYLHRVEMAYESWKNENFSPLQVKNVIVLETEDFDLDTKEASLRKVAKFV